MKKLGLCAVAAVLFASPAIAAPQCAEMRFLDAKGVLLPKNPPLIGIAIGERYLFEGFPPEYAKQETGRFVPCPEALIASVKKTFQDSCSSNDKRAAAAAANGVDIAVVNKGCGEMAATLSK